MSLSQCFIHFFLERRVFLIEKHDEAAAAGNDAGGAELVAAPCVM